MSLLRPEHPFREEAYTVPQRPLKVRAVEAIKATELPTPLAAHAGIAQINIMLGSIDREDIMFLVGPDVYKEMLALATADDKGGARLSRQLANIDPYE